MGWFKKDKVKEKEAFKQAVNKIVDSQKVQAEYEKAHQERMAKWQSSGTTNTPSSITYNTGNPQPTTTNTTSGSNLTNLNSVLQQQYITAMQTQMNMPVMWPSTGPGLYDAPRPIFIVQKVDSNGFSTPVASFYHKSHADKYAEVNDNSERDEYHEVVELMIATEIIQLPEGETYDLSTSTDDSPGID